jgi:hypothetical protein
MYRHCSIAALALFSTAWACATPQPPEPPQPADSLTAKLGTPEHKAVTAIFEAWNTTHTRARAAIKTQTDRYRSKKEQVPPVVHYAAALVMMQIGAYAAPDVESIHLPKAGDHPLVALAKTRIAIREDDFTRASKMADLAVDDKRAGRIGEMMKDAVKAMSDPNAGKSVGKSTTARSATSDPVVSLIADARAKSDADLADKRTEMKRLDLRYQSMGNELVRLQREYVLIQNRSAGVLPGGFRGYYFSDLEKSTALANCQNRINALENERNQAKVRHAELKKYEADELAKLTWRIWSARFPWNVEDERKRLTAGKSAAEYYGAEWEYKPSLPVDFPKQIPAPFTSKKKKS